MGNKDTFDSGCSEHKLGYKEPLAIFEIEMYINLFPARIEDWRISSDRCGKVQKIIRDDRTSESYKNMESLVKSYDREDLDTLWKLVQLDFMTPGNVYVKA